MDITAATADLKAKFAAVSDSAVTHSAMREWFAQYMKVAAQAKREGRQAEFDAFTAELAA
jgi:hypothetical protein